MKTISLKLPEHLHSRLGGLARGRSRGKSALIRDAIERYVAAEAGSLPESVLEGIEDLDGIFKGAPDLATNPKYLKDFGNARTGDRRRRATGRVSRPRRKA